MHEPFDADRLVWGGSLYPPPDIPPGRHPWIMLFALIAACAAIWVVVGVMIWPVL